jgi:putative DNA primase/helicase
MIALARSEPELSAASTIWDRNPWLLNVANGTIDLRTGELQQHRQADMLTMLAPVDYSPESQAPRFEKFLERVQPDPEVRAWIQRYLGYSISGDVREQCLSFFYGGGSNGKSVLLDVVLQVIGGYGLRAAADLVLAKHGEAHPTELADLEGKRFVVCSEIEQGRAWAESLIKRITGDQTITARRMRQDFYTFPATHKLVVAANTRPIVRGTDHGIWRRMRLVPWLVRIPDAEQNKSLPEELVQEEAPGILAWLVRGCIAWQNRGLGSPQAISDATAAYRATQDLLGRWIEDRCVLGDSEWHATTSLYESFCDWCKSEGMRDPWQRNTWRERMLERDGIEEARMDHGRIRALTGLKLKVAQ